MRQKNRRFKDPSKWFAALVAAPLAVLLMFGTAAPAFAAPSTTVGITQTGDSTQPSGNTFDYQVAFQCSNVDDPPAPCEDVEIRIPLDAAAGFDVDVPGLSNPDQWYVDEASGELVIVVGEVAAGASSSVPFTVTPPNHTTEDGRTWTLAPTATSSNATAGDGPLPEPYLPEVSSTATAELHHTITKTLDGSVFREPGDEVTWTLVVACNQTGSGNLLAQSMTVADTLPAGLSFVSSTPPASTVDGQRVGWALPGDGELPASCAEAGGSGSFTIEITALVDADFVPSDGAERLTNGASVTAIGIGETEGVTHDAESSITVTDDPSAFPGNLGKDSFGQLNGDGSAGSEGSRTTFPGPWNGYYDQQPGNVMGNNRPNVDTDYEQSGYQLRYRNDPQALGFQVALAEPMPCFADGDAGDAVHTSLSPGTRCAEDDLAFHPTTVSIWSHNPASYGLPPITDGYVPTGVRASDGSTFPLVLTERGDSWANYAVPAAEVGNVAELNFPRDPGMASDDMRWGIFGYADEDTRKGDVVRNVGTATSYYGTSDEVAGVQSHSADLFIIDDPIIGVQKSIAPTSVEMGATVPTSILAFLDTRAAADSDLVVTDLLPEGFSVAERPATVPSALEIGYIPAGQPSGVNVVVDADLPLEIVDNFQGTGRQLIRVTLPVELIADYGSVQVAMPLAFDVIAPDAPGTYTNTAQVFYDDVDLSTTCNQVPQVVQIADDPLNLDGNDATQRHCQGQDDVTINAPSGSADFAITKTVQGDTDDAPRVPPAVGLVTEEGGSAVFGLNWTNTGAATLDDVVMYDIFPRVGDTGVSGNQAGGPRGSEFDAVFQGIGAEVPEGVTISYTTAENPCRPEVFPGQGECTDDWSTTAPADPGTVTGIRIVSDLAYATGEGFHVDVLMTTPPIELGQVAWNSVAGVATDTTSGTPLLPAEPPKVGITAYDPNLPPVLEKVADVATAAPGDEVTYTIWVTNPASWSQEGVDLSDTLPAGLTFVSATGEPTVAGQVLTWAPFDLEPWEIREFTVVATVDAGVTGTIANVATIPGAITPDPCPDEDGAACAPVDVDAASLTITKVVDGEGAAFAGDAFSVTVDCRLADGASALGFPRDVDVTTAEPATLAVPIATTCVVTEPDAAGATSVSVDPEAGVVIGSEANAAYAVTVTNTFDAGGLVIDKHLTGVGAAAFGSGPFTFQVDCSFEGEPVFGELVELVPAEGADSVASGVLGPLPVGASCIVAEQGAAGADAVAPPVEVEIVSDAATANVTTVAIVNEYSAGSIELSKRVEGDGASAPGVADARFAILVTCQIDAGAGPQTVFSRTTEIEGGATVTLADEDGNAILLPVGAHCFAAETATGGATQVKIEHDSYETGVVVEAGQPGVVQRLELEVVNVFAAPPAPTQPGGALPTTGASGLGGWLLAAVVALGVAVVLRVENRRRDER